MSILFSDIYTKAIALFDDPKITIAYQTNIIQFDKLMYTYLQNAISMFNNPVSIGMRLATYNEPVGTMEIFEGDGETSTFTLDENFEIRPNSHYCFIEGNIKVQGDFDEETRTVKFPDILPKGQQYAFEQYYVGEFTGDFSGLNQNTSQGNTLIINSIKDILARLLVKSWAESERNLLMDIRNILQDSDFKLTSNARILESKNKWIDQLEWEVLQYQNRLAWNIRFMKGSTHIGRG